MLVSLIGVGRLFFGLSFLGLFVTCVLHLVSWGCSGCFFVVVVVVVVVVVF